MEGLMVKEKKKLPQLTEKLFERQRFLNLTDDEFAAYLGIASDTWTKIKGGRAGYGSKSLVAVLVKFPEFLEYVQQLQKWEGSTTDK